MVTVDNQVKHLCLHLNEAIILLRILLLALMQSLLDSTIKKGRHDGVDDLQRVKRIQKPIRTVFASTHSDTAMRVPLRITYLEKELAVDCLGVITPGCRFGRVLSQLLVVNGCLIECLCIELFEARNVYRADITKGDDFLLAF